MVVLLLQFLLVFARDRLDKKWMKNELFQFCEYNLQYFMDLDSFNGETIKKIRIYL